MITREQALSASEFHYGVCTRTVGIRGGVTIHIERWRRNGKTKTWVRNPHRFEVPVKHGLKHYYTISEDSDSWHTEEDCPLHEHFS